MLSFLARTFPPPSYLRMPAFGLDISDETLKFITLQPYENGIRVGHFGQKTIPAGLIASGEVKKPEELGAFLKEALGSIGMKYVYLALPEEKGYMNVVELPLLRNDEIRTALEAQFSEYVPLPVGDAIFDFEVFQGAHTSLRKRLEIAMVSFPSRLIEDYYTAIRLANLIPLAFDAEVQAIARAVISRDDRDAVMIVDFGKTRTTFIIVAEQQVRFTATINVAGKDIDAVIAKAFSVSLIEAERIKKEEGSMTSAPRNRKVFETILPLVSAISDEVERYVAFWETHAANIHYEGPRSSLKKVLLVGGDANLTGLPEYLGHNLHLDVGYGNIWSNVASFEDYIPPITFRESLMYGSAVGLALRDFEV